MSIPLGPNFTPVESVLPKIKPLEQDEFVISTEWLKRNYAEIRGDMSWRNSC